MSKREPCTWWITHRFNQRVTEDSWPPKVMSNFSCYFSWPAEFHSWGIKTDKTVPAVQQLSLQQPGSRRLPAQAFMSQCDCRILFVEPTGQWAERKQHTDPDMQTNKKHSQILRAAYNKGMFLKLQMLQRAQKRFSRWDNYIMYNILCNIMQ